MSGHNHLHSVQLSPPTLKHTQHASAWASPSRKASLICCSGTLATSHQVFPSLGRACADRACQLACWRCQGSSGSGQRALTRWRPRSSKAAMGRRNSRLSAQVGSSRKFNVFGGDCAWLAQQFPLAPTSERVYGYACIHMHAGLAGKWQMITGI